MRFRFTPLGKQHVKRFFKRQPMDTALEWDSVLTLTDANEYGEAGISRTSTNYLYD